MGQDTWHGFCGVAQSHTSHMTKIGKLEIFDSIVILNPILGPNSEFSQIEIPRNSQWHDNTILSNVLVGASYEKLKKLTFLKETSKIV